MAKAPKKEPMATITVAMLKKYRPAIGETLNKGEIATFPESLAKDLIRAGIASADAAV